ncbi:hypothetical protein H8D83_01285 [Candidatus Woesearchaeota archaeon]|nr:hypothetical protein [Candidatus Woesearchaeota archaeon]
MEYIIITESFRKTLKKFKKYFHEKDIVFDIKRLIEKGFGKGETKLKNENYKGLDADLFKLRLKINNVDFRYIIVCFKSKNEYLPVFIDLKKGRYGRNLSFNSDKKTVAIINDNLEKVIIDYLTSTSDNPLTTYYAVDGN